MIRLLWHSIMLSEYWRVKRIPRGLRLKKTPSFGQDDPEFMQKWEKILNKCSLDLMLLVIEKTTAEREKTSASIKQTEAQLKAQTDADTFSTISDQINASLKTFQAELQNYKIEKYERDTKDYSDGRVYTWNKREKKQRRTRATTRQQNRVQLSSASEWESPQTSDAETQQDTRSFLPNSKPHRGRGGGRGGARGATRGRPPSGPPRRSPRNQY